MSTSIILLRSASMPELRNAQLTKTAPLRIYFFNRFPAKNETTSAEDNNSGPPYVNAETRANRVDTCPLLAREAGPDLHYAWRHDSGQIFGSATLDRIGGSFQALFPRPHSTWTSDDPGSLSRDDARTSTPLSESLLVKESVTGYPQGQDADCPRDARDVGRADASHGASGWHLGIAPVPILPFFTPCHEGGTHKDTGKLSRVSAREEGQSQLGQSCESSMRRRVLGAQDLADHGEACLQESLPVQRSSLAYRGRPPTDGKKRSKKSKVANKTSVEKNLRLLRDTDQTTCDEGPSRGVLDVERYQDALLGHFPEDAVAYPIRSRQPINPAFEKKLDDIEAAVVRSGLLIGDKYMEDEYLMEFLHSTPLKKPVIFVVRPDPDESMEELLQTCGSVRWSFYFIGRDGKLHGYQDETGGYCVGVFNKMEAKAIAKFIIREQM